MGWVNTGDKREQILKAAENCLREQGLSRVNIREIAKEAGVSIGSVHYYFSTKEHILMEIFRKFVERVSKSVPKGSKEADPSVVLLGFLDGFFDELAADPGACRIFMDLWGHAGKHPELQELLKSYYRRSLKWAQKLIEQGVEQGVFRVEDPLGAAVQIIAIIDGVKVQQLLFGKKIDLARTRKACKEFVENALRAPE